MIDGRGNGYGDGYGNGEGAGFCYGTGDGDGAGYFTGYYTGSGYGYGDGSGDAMLKKAGCCEVNENKLEKAKAFIKAECYCAKYEMIRCPNCQFLEELK